MGGACPVLSTGFNRPWSGGACLPACLGPRVDAAGGTHCSEVAAPLPSVHPERALSCLPDEQTYLLRDAEAEVLFSFSLEESLKRAHVSPLFKVTRKEKPDKSA